MFKMYLKPVGFCVGLAVVNEVERRVEDDAMTLSLRNWTSAEAVY